MRRPWWLLIDLVILVGSLWGLLIALERHVPERDQRQYNFLQSTLTDLAHPTTDNAWIIQTECTDYQRKATEYRKISVRNIDELVGRYVVGCAARGVSQ